MSVRRIKDILQDFLPSVLITLVSEYVRIEHSLKRLETFCTKNKNADVCHLINDNEMWTYSYIYNTLKKENYIQSPIGYLSIHDICIDEDEIYSFEYPTIRVFNKKCEYIRLINMPPNNSILHTVKNKQIYTGKFNHLIIYDTYGKYIEDAVFQYNIYDIIPSDKSIYVLHTNYTIIKCSTDNIFSQNNIMLHTNDGKLILVQSLCVIDDYFYTTQLKDWNMYVHDEDGNYVKQIYTMIITDGQLYYSDSMLYIYRTDYDGNKRFDIYYTDYHNM